MERWGRGWGHGFQDEEEEEWDVRGDFGVRKRCGDEVMRREVKGKVMEAAMRYFYFF